MRGWVRNTTGSNLPAEVPSPGAPGSKGEGWSRPRYEQGRPIGMALFIEQWNTRSVEQENRLGSSTLSEPADLPDRSTAVSCSTSLLLVWEAESCPTRVPHRSPERGRRAKAGPTPAIDPAGALGASGGLICAPASLNPRRGPPCSEFAEVGSGSCFSGFDLAL